MIIFVLMRWNKKVKIIAVSVIKLFLTILIDLFFFFNIYKLQASEALRNTSHSCTAADLLQAKQQILSHQQQLEDQECLLKNYQRKNEEFEVQITHLQGLIKTYEMVCSLSEKYLCYSVSFS